MVGIFSRFQGYMTRPHTAALEKREGPVAVEVEAHAIDTNGDHLAREGNGVVEADDEFKPIEHPLEPPDEDQPAKCPLPDSSLVNGEGEWKEPFAEGLLKRAESLRANRKSTVEQSPTQVDSKRHHSVAPDLATSPSLRGPQYNIFQVFQQCKEL